MFDADSLIVGTSSGLSVGGMILIFGKIWISRSMERMDRQDKRISDLEDKRLTAIEKDMEEIEQKCIAHKSDNLAARLEERLAGIEKTTNRTESKVDVIGKDLASVQTLTDTHERFIKSVHGEIRQHAANSAIHGGKAT